MFDRFIRWRQKRHRQIDIDILWPRARAHAFSLPHAREAFRLYIALDPDWRALTPEERDKIIDNLQ